MPTDKPFDYSIFGADAQIAQDPQNSPTSKPIPKIPRMQPKITVAQSKENMEDKKIQAFLAANPDQQKRVNELGSRVADSEEASQSGSLGPNPNPESKYVKNPLPKPEKPQRSPEEEAYRMTMMLNEPPRFGNQPKDNYSPGTSAAPTREAALKVLDMHRQAFLKRRK